MPAPVHLLHATVTTPHRTHVGVSVELKPGTTNVVVRNGGVVLEDAGPVTLSQAYPGGRWVLTFENGHVWELQRTKRPGCGSCGG